VRVPEGIDDHQEFLIVDLIIDFHGLKFPGVEGYRV